MEITTTLPPEGDPEDHGVEVPVMPVAGVSEGGGGTVDSHVLADAEKGGNPAVL